MSQPLKKSAIETGPSQLDVTAFSTANRRRLSAPGLRTFLTIADLWNLSEKQRRLVLGLPPRSTYQSWVRAVREHRDILLDLDVVIRLSAALGIHQALGILFARETEGVAWLRRPNAATVFGGSAPLSLVTSGTQDALLTVRRFLDAARGGLSMEPNAVDRDATPYSDEDLVLS